MSDPLSRDRQLALVRRAAAAPDLDAACRIIQDEIGQEDGGIAGEHFAGDRENAYAIAVYPERVEMLHDYLKVEIAFAAPMSALSASERADLDACNDAELRALVREADRRAAGGIAMAPRYKRQAHEARRLLRERAGAGQ